MYAYGKKTWMDTLSEMMVLGLHHVEHITDVTVNLCGLDKI
ncbi:hypothetical protein ACLM5H_07605 [Fredinandcohnia humi]